MGEFKRTKPQLGQPPEEYLHKKVDSIPPQAVPDATLDDVSEDPLAQGERTRPSDEAMRKPLGESSQVSCKPLLTMF